MIAIPTLVRKLPGPGPKDHWRACPTPKGPSWDCQLRAALTRDARGRLGVGYGDGAHDPADRIEPPRAQGRDGAITRRLEDAEARWSDFRGPRRRGGSRRPGRGTAGHAARGRAARRAAADRPVAPRRDHFGATGEILHANPVFGSLIGVEPQRLFGRQIIEIVARRSCAARRDARRPCTDSLAVLGSRAPPAWSCACGSPRSRCSKATACA